MTEIEKQAKRRLVVDTALRLIGVPYIYGAEWTAYAVKPSALDCSEMVEGVFTIAGLTMPDGSQNQFNFCKETLNPDFGNLVFFGREKDQKKVYHVGIIVNTNTVIEARAYDPNVSFETGKVIFRPLDRWRAYKNFLGWRSHPNLI